MIAASATKPNPNNRKSSTMTDLEWETIDTAPGNFVKFTAIGDGITGTVLAMWYLGNYDGHISPAWAFTLTDTLGLTEGQSVEVYAANYEEATWTPAGTATVNGGVLVSSEGGGIPLLTTLIFVAP